MALVTLGCARNEVDSEELAARLERGGFRLVDDADDADAVLVNTCGFVESAKKDSVDTLLEATGDDRAVVAVGCLAERYGEQLAEALPEADAVLGFDAYPDIADRLRALLDGEPQPSHTPAGPPPAAAADPGRPRRHATSASPATGSAEPDLPAGVGAGVRAAGACAAGSADGPVAPVKLASGCDRRCSFCAIPSFRGSFVSRPADEVLADARWLAGDGVRELFCVSENTTSYGKDLGDLRLLERLLPELAAVDGVERVRVSYLQPAETRPGLLDVHGRHPRRRAVLRPVLPARQRAGAAPDAPLRRPRAVPRPARRRTPPGAARRHPQQRDRGVPGRDRGRRRGAVRLPRPRRGSTWSGVFGYSDEDGTEAATLDGHLDDGEVRDRADRVGRLVEELTAQRAEDRVGEPVEVLVESRQRRGEPVEGRAAHQGPDVDGSTTVLDAPAGRPRRRAARRRVVGSEGVDLVARYEGGRR